MIEQFVYLGILILVGVIILSLRRKAQGSRTGYKLVLVLAGILIGLIATTGTNPIITFDKYFLKTICVFLLVVLTFELSSRLNSDNIKLDFDNVSMFFIILILNVVVLGIVSTFLLQVQFMHGLILAIILSSVEYFLVNQLKSEGDFANPLIIFFAFSILVFYNLDGDMINNMAYLLKYIIIGLGIGVLAGIITFRFLKNKPMTKTAELGIIAVALATYIITEQLAGSGLFAVMILGTFFGNSFVRRAIKMDSFSPTVFKTLEMLIYILIGIVTTISIKSGVWWRALIIFAIYIILRLIVIHFYYKHYSIENKLLLTFAPKGMVLGIMILILGVYSTVNQTLQEAMIFILIYSLIAGIFVEYFEQQKELRLDKTLKALSMIRFGRKKDLLRKKSQ